MIKQEISKSNNQPEHIREGVFDEISETNTTANQTHKTKAKTKGRGKNQLSGSQEYSRDSEEEKNEDIPAKLALGENIEEVIISANGEEIKPKMHLEKFKELSLDSEEYSSSSKKEEIFAKELPSCGTLKKGATEEEINLTVETKKGQILSLGSNNSKEDAKETPAKKSGEEPQIDTSSDSEEEIKPKKRKESSSESEEETNQQYKKIIKAPPYKTGADTEIFIGNLPYQTTSDDLHNLFSKRGEIRSIKLVYDCEGNPKGIAYVNFSDIESTNKALDLNGEQFMGRNIRVLPSSDKPPGPKTTATSQSQDKPEEAAIIGPSIEKSTTIFVRNLSFTSTIDSIRNFFEVCGEIKDIGVALDSKGNHRGFAFIEFFAIDAAEKAIQLNERVLNGRKIKLDYSKS
mmetsp:Transcript_19994/g.20053  ORF Transcript_19994/g.20053 Transcript_19994/m.20053 type:complete len:403 (-) Transcript_19994:30-1238(-)